VTVQQNYKKKRREKLWVVRAREKVVRTKRSRYEIMAGIMQDCLLPRCKTHIMYKGNMSFTQINAYLSMLISLGLLSQVDGKYETTDRGRQFISAYNSLGEIMGKPSPLLTGMRVFSGS
jgi:predicted transcriptional regulator